MRLKKEFEALEQPLEMILNMSGMSYAWRTEEFPDRKLEDGRQVGFIAQDLEKILPAAVRTDGEGYKSVSYTTVVPVLVEAVKVQEKQINAQRKQINAQQKQHDEQQKQIDVQQKQIEDLKAAVAQLLTRSRL